MTFLWIAEPKCFQLPGKFLTVAAESSELLRAESMFLAEALEQNLSSFLKVSD